MAYGTITETLENVLKRKNTKENMTIRRNKDFLLNSPENGLQELEGIEFQINMPIDLDVDFIVTKY